jgi:NAD(P)-dependent dehydrogenase (short-subunit alcohol dehydrogenase family)
LAEEAAVTFAGRVAIVTGAGGGLGRAIASEFHQGGANVVLVDRDEARLDAVAADLGAPDRVMVFACDLTDENAVANLASATADQLGSCDVLVNNAGILGAPQPLASLSTAVWNETIGVNLTAAMLCTRELGQVMIRGGGGAVVNIASVGAHSPNTSPAYGVSKAGLVALTRHTAVEWGPLGVRANAVSPGFVRTEMSAGHYADPDLLALRTELTPVRRIGVASDIASAVAYLAGDGAAFVNGQEIVIDGGFLAAPLMHVQRHADQYGGHSAPEPGLFADRLRSAAT